MINLTHNEPEKPKGVETENPDPDNFIVDKETGVLRPKEKKSAPQPKGIVPKAPTTNTMDSYSDVQQVELNPADWILSQATIMGCIPVNEDNTIPEELMPYVNANFNVYPAQQMHKYIDEFKGALLLHNHKPDLAFGLTVEVKPRVVKVGKHDMIYIDILTAVSRKLNRKFAKDIETRKVKYLSFGHTSGGTICSVCQNDSASCIHIAEMLFRQTPEPPILDGKPYGILHQHNEDFHVYDVSYLDVKPAYSGAVSHSTILLDKPLTINVSKEALLQKARYAQFYEEHPLEPEQVVGNLIGALGI